MYERIGSTIKYLLLILIMSVFCGGQPAYAKKTLADAPSALGTVVAPTGIDESDLSTAAANVVQGILGAMGILFFGLMVYAGMVWMLARGDDARVTKARETIIAATIGLIVVVGAYVVTIMVVDRIILGSTPDGGDPTNPSKPNQFGGKDLVCCITPAILPPDPGQKTAASALNYFALPSKMSFLTPTQCEQLAKGTVYTEDDGESYYNEKGAYWDMYESVHDTETCTKIYNCWPTNGSLSDKNCINTVLIQLLEGNKNGATS
jgi:cbb3-type cytochrome oxidase subunit 3